MNINAFPFENAYTTAGKLRIRIPVYSEGALQSALESGCQSVPAVMAFMARRDANLQANRARNGRNNNARRVRV